MIPFLVGVVAIIAIAYLGVIYTSTAFVMLSFCGVIFMLMAYVTILVMMHYVHCQISIPIGMAEKEKPIFIDAVASNRSRIPVFKMRYFLRYSNTYVTKKRKLRIDACVDGKGCSRTRATLTSDYSGDYSFVLYKVRIYDMLGIFYLTKYTKSKGQVQVMPEAEQVNIVVTQASRYFVGETEVFDDKKSGDDVSEIFQIRRFRDGDKLQSIHWKLSAKENDLMVKENSLPQGCPVIMELTLPAGKEYRDVREEHLSNFYEMVFSISLGLLEHACVHYIAWYSEKEKDVVRIRIDKEEKLYFFLMLLFEEERIGKKQDVEALYKEKYKAESYVTRIDVDYHGMLTVGGVNLGRQLSQVEIRV